MTGALLLIVVSCGAAAAAFWGNRVLFAIAGAEATVFAVPWWEEACKFAASWLIAGTPVMGVHLLFGLGELGYDVARLRREGWFVGLYSCLGHMLYGWVATYAAARLVAWWPPYLLAVAVHLIFNAVAVTLLLPTFDAGDYAGARER